MSKEPYSFITQSLQEVVTCFSGCCLVDALKSSQCLFESTVEMEGTTKKEELHKPASRVCHIKPKSIYMKGHTEFI